MIDDDVAFQLNALLRSPVWLEIIKPRLDHIHTTEMARAKRMAATPNFSQVVQALARAGLAEELMAFPETEIQLIQERADELEEDDARNEREEELLASYDREGVHPSLQPRRDEE